MIAIWNRSTDDGNKNNLNPPSLIVGETDGTSVGIILGLWDGMFVGVLLGIFVGEMVAIFVGLFVGMYVGFSKTNKGNNIFI